MQTLYSLHIIKAVKDKKVTFTLWFVPSKLIIPGLMINEELIIEILSNYY